MSLPFPCPFCAEPIREEAFRCPQCHSWLVPWTFRHKWVPGLLGLVGGTFLIYDGIKERFLTDVPGWVLIALGSLLALYGLYHLLRSTRSSFEEGRKDLLEKYRQRVAEREED
jgi:hypothetical protein